MPGPAIPGADVALITVGTELPGAHLVTLTAPDRETQLLGVVVAERLPCSAGRGDDLPGCGAPASVTVVRSPLRGLNLPGEHIVGLVHHCDACGTVQTTIAAATTTEIDNGWAPGTVS